VQREGSRGVVILTYFFVMAALVVVTRVIAIFFTSGLLRALRVVPEQSASRAGHVRYATRALLGVYPVPTGYLRVLCWILRLAVPVLFAGFCGWLYIAFSGATDESPCLRCRLDPASKSLAFWLGYTSAILMLISVHAGSAMVARWDPRQHETSASLDVRRMKFALTMIFTDALVPDDRVARTLRDVCRWTMLLGVLAFVGWLVSSRAGV
jgi:hypothetical protein